MVSSCRSNILTNTRCTIIGFWVFMYRVSPFTYLAAAMLATGVGNAQVICADNEYLRFQPPPGQTCQTWITPYERVAGGYMQNPDATSDCSFCSVSSTNVSASFRRISRLCSLRCKQTVLAGYNIYYGDRWRNLGILFA